MQDKTNPWYTNTSTIFLIPIIGFLTLILMRFQRGIIGLILGLTGGLLLFFWVREFKKTVKQELSPSNKNWDYEIQKTMNSFNLTATLTQPEPSLSVSLFKDKLQIKGQKFEETITVSKNMILDSHSYINNVLYVKLIKNQKLKKDDE